VTSLLCALIIAASPSDGPPDRRAEPDLPLSRAARPLVLPKGWYQVDLAGRYTEIAPDEPLFRLDFGGTLGLERGLFVRVDLLRWNFSRAAGYGLEQPRVGFGYGFVRGGVVELAGEVGVEVPSGGDFAGDLGLSMRVHGGRWLRMDVETGIRGSSSDIRAESEADGRARLVVNPIAPLSLAAASELRLVTLTGAESLVGRLWGELGLAFPRADGAPSWELIARVGTPERTLAGADLEPPRLGQAWSAGLELRLFFDAPASSFDDPWAEDW
jgi:hypothetical protein